MTAAIPPSCLVHPTREGRIKQPGGRGFDCTRPAAGSSPCQRYRAMLHGFVRVPEGNELDVIPVKIAARREGSGGGRGSRIGYRKPASALIFDHLGHLSSRRSTLSV